MEFSKNIATEPMTHRQRSRMEAVREVIRGLTQQVVHEPIPAQSDHFRPEPVQLHFTPEMYERLNKPDDVA